MLDFHSLQAIVLWLITLVQNIVISISFMELHLEMPERQDDLYAERFPDRRHPSINTFAAVHNRLRETGKFEVSMADTGREKSVRSVAFEEDVLQRFEENPRTSTRAVGSSMNVSTTTVRRVLHEERMHPFHLQKSACP